MKLLHSAAFAILLASVACRLVPFFPHEYTATNITTLIKVFGAPSAQTAPAIGADSPPPAKRPRPNPTLPDPVASADPNLPAAGPQQSEWDKAVCRGEKLTRASKLGKKKAEAFALPIDTKWDGNLEAERKTWGYFDSFDVDCDFEGDYYDIRTAYESLNLLDSQSNDCFRTFHYDPELEVDENGNEVEVQDQTYQVDGKTYHATGAHATFGVNIDEGVVFFIDVASATLKAAELWGIEKAPVDQLPALRQMSDLSWGFWHEAHGGSNLGHITKFVVVQIINDVTLRLIKQSLETYEVTEGERRLDTVPAWPGLTFDIDTDQGKALLGSPNGIAAAYFLSQHKQQIGVNKYVHKVTVFKPDEENETGSEEPTIVYYVQDAPETSSEDEDNLTEDLQRRDLVLAAVDTSVWQKHVCRGEKLSQASKLDKDKATEFIKPINSPWEGTMEADLKIWGYKELPADSHCNFDDIAVALKALKIGRLSKSEGGLNHCFQIRHVDDEAQIAYEDQTYTVDNKVYRATGAYSIIGANPRSGVIFFVDRRSASRAAEELWYPEVPTPETLPALRTMSDISWAFWNRVHQNYRKGQNHAKINHFIVHNIVNKETEALIQQALETYDVPDGQQRVTELPGWPGITFDVETEAGQAMLGSPNGIAAGYFLAQHKTQLGGNKYVHQIQVFASEQQFFGPSMVLSVKDAPVPAAGGIQNALARRDAVAVAEPSSVSTMADDATFWWKYVCRGEKLTQASMRNKDTAVLFANPIDSEWDGTMEQELNLWGYTDYKGKSIYCELDNIVDNLNQIGVDGRFKSRGGQNDCYNIGHRRSGATSLKDQTYDIDSKTYRMTDAFSHMGVNTRDGVVTFLNVRSAERGAIITWKVDTPDLNELPKLRQISDLAWAFWKRSHSNDAGLNNINKFLVHDIVNDDTLKLIKMALKTYHVPEGQQRYTLVPRWPGLVFDIETEEGKAMLGSPNGVAAGYFLAQHKTQLGGNKYVYQVTVWDDREGDTQMMFWVKTAPLPPAEEMEQDRSRTPTPEQEGGFIKRSMDGRNFVREHVVLAKL